MFRFMIYCEFCVRCDMWIEIHSLGVWILICAFGTWVFIYSRAVCWRDDHSSIELPSQFCRKRTDCMCSSVLGLSVCFLIYMSSILMEKCNRKGKEKKWKEREETGRTAKGRYRQVCVCTCTHWSIMHGTFGVSLANVKILNSSSLSALFYHFSDPYLCGMKSSGFLASPCKCITYVHLKHQNSWRNGIDQI